jgi:hypothetical protein
MTDYERGRADALAEAVRVAEEMRFKWANANGTDEEMAARDQCQRIIGKINALSPSPDHVLAPRDPTEAMIDAAMGPWAELYPAFDGQKPIPTSGKIAATIYRAMIAEVK